MQFLITEMQEISEKKDDALTRFKYIASNCHLVYIYISSALFHCSYFVSSELQLICFSLTLLYH